MTAQEFRAARELFGMTAEDFGLVLGVASGRTVRRWEAGDRAIPGPAAVLVHALVHGPGVRRYFALETVAERQAINREIAAGKAAREAKEQAP